MTGDAITMLATALAGRYVIEHELGRGGMATVYLARDLKHDRLVASWRGRRRRGSDAHACVSMDFRVPNDD